MRGSSQPGINEQVMEQILECSWEELGHSLAAREEICWNYSSVAGPNLHMAMGTFAERDSLYAGDFNNRKCSIHVPELDPGKPDEGNREKGAGICMEISFSCSALLCEGSRCRWNAAGGNSSLAVAPASMEKSFQSDLRGVLSSLREM